MKRTMRALVKARSEEGLWMEEVPIPEVGPRDVKLRVVNSAICGTDLHIYLWDEWARRTIPVPMVVGHEFVGVIDEVGSAVSEYKPGQRASGEGHITCGYCRNCRSGKRHLCRNTLGVGIHRPGSFAEYVVIPADNVVLIPDEIPDRVASIFDPLGNAVHTACSFDVVGEDVLITGAGPIGLMGAVIARHCGARHVVITDVNPYRLGIAKDLGVTRAVNVKETSLQQVMNEIGMKEGFDVGLEMSGNRQAFRDMITAMNNGGKIALLGIFSEEVSIDWSAVIFKGLFLKGIYGREMYETWYKMKSMLQSGLNIDSIITHTLPVEEYLKGFEMMREGSCAKVVLDW